MNYNRLITPLGISAHRCFLDAFGIGTAVAGLANMAGTLITNRQNADLQREINKKNVENQWQLFRAQNARQDYLNANQDLIKRQSLQRAGLNVNSEFGGYPNIATNSVSSAVQNAPVMNAPDLSTFATLLQNAPLVKAQARKENADAERQEIENEHTKTYDRVLDAFYKDNFSSNDADGNNVLDDVVVNGKSRNYNKGTFDAQQRIRDYKTHVNGLDVQDIRYQLDKLIYSNQLQDSETVKALSDMPIWHRKKIEEECLNLAKDRAVMDSVITLNNANANKADKDAALTDLEMRLKEDSSIFPLIEKYIPEGGFRDFAMFMAILLSSLTGSNMNFGKKITNNNKKTTVNNTGDTHNNIMSHRNTTISNNK